MGSQEKSSASRNAQLVRVLAVLRDLDRLGGVDIYELAERYGTTTRTVRRDLAALEDLGLPLVQEPDGKRMRWRVAFRSELDKLTQLLDASHYLALRVAMGQGGVVRSASSIFASLEDLAQKIESALGPKERARLAAIDACFHSYEKFAYRRSPPDVFWPLVEAISGERRCRVTYRAPRPRPRDKTFVITPLRLFAHGGSVYLFAHVPKHDQVIVLNVQRLQKLVVLKTRGVRPARFDPSQWENTAFGIMSGTPTTTYRLRFDPSVAQYIRERVWHPTQTMEDLPHGGVELAFTCAESYEVTAWVASWRRGVEVLAPARLREELRRFGAWLEATYRRAPGPPGPSARKLGAAGWRMGHGWPSSRARTQGRGG